MKRYLVRAEIQQSSAVVAALAAASISVAESPPDSDGQGPARARGMTLAVNAHSGEEAVEEVRQALKRWGKIEAQVVGEEPLQT